MSAAPAAPKVSANCRSTARLPPSPTPSRTPLERMSVLCRSLPKCFPPWYGERMPENARPCRIRCQVNGKPAEFEAFPMERLLDALRERLRLTGTKEGCGEGECGACAVEMNGGLVNSCLVPAVQAEGAEIRTIEGVAQAGHLHAIQQAFLEYGGAQCGICTPGMILA